MDNATKVDETINKGDSALKKTIKLVVSLGIGFFILWMMYRETNFDTMWLQVKDANFAILLFSLIFGMLGNTFRGLRWKLIIEPLGYNPSTSNLIFAVYGSYAVNLIFPRAGEIWRCGVIAKDEKIPFVKLIGTLLIDRAFDTIMVILITLLACCFNLDFFLNYIKENESLSASLGALFSSKWLYIGIASLLILIYVVFGVLKNTKPVMKIKEFFVSLGKDFVMVWHMKKKKRFFIYTLSIWFSYFLYFYLTFFAFDFTKDLGITAGLIAFALSSLSMGIPTNGGVGVWHAAVILSLGLYGVAQSSAEAFAFGVFAIQNIWIVLVGIFGFVAMGLNGNKAKS